MGKRLERYYQPQLLEKLPTLLNQRISLVMDDDRVHDGTLLEISATIKIKDRLGRNHVLPAEKITELIYDYEAPW